MRLLTISVSPVKEVIYQGKIVATGILKEPVSGRVMVRRLNIDGDDQADRKVHGGLDMAVYAYSVEHYAFWEGELGRKGFPHGQFGENLTVSGMDEETVQVGDIFRIGEALLQVTQPRIPCYKLAIRMEQGLDFPGRFQQTGRMGFYFRVLEEGEVGAGDPIESLERDESSATIAQFIRVYLKDALDPPSLKHVLGFMGDALMPFYGEPWVAEGFIDDAMDTMDEALRRQPEHILHGHVGITAIYGTMDQLKAYRDAHEWLVDEARRHLANGYSAKDIIRLNLIPPDSTTIRRHSLATSRLAIRSLT